MSQYKSTLPFSCFSWVFITMKGLTNPLSSVVRLRLCYSVLISIVVCDVSTLHHETPDAYPAVLKVVPTESGQVLDPQVTDWRRIAQ